MDARSAFLIVLGRIVKVLPQHVNKGLPGTAISAYSIGKSIIARLLAIGTDVLAPNGHTLWYAKQVIRGTVKFVHYL